MSKPTYNNQNFIGVVYLKESFWHTDGKHYWGFLGYCTPVENKALAGFDADNKSANFCVRVAGKADGSGSVMNVLGCQIRVISALETFPKDLAGLILDVRQL